MSGESDSDDAAVQQIELQNQTNTKINTRAQPKYSVPQHSKAVSYSFDAGHMYHPQMRQEVSGKLYFIVGYRIIIHLLLIYCVIAVTYLLFIDECGL